MLTRHRDSGVNAKESWNATNECKIAEGTPETLPLLRLCVKGSYRNNPHVATTTGGGGRVAVKGGEVEEVEEEEEEVESVFNRHWRNSGRGIQGAATSLRRRTNNPS
ncbi:hypothetical protein M0804_009799 [Polistes exclamans]|nr:hypothetical protein M0804_009799 [Polistes exclamans]